MANRLTAQAVRDGIYPIRPYEDGSSELQRDAVTVAHRMVETYCAAPFPVKEVTATYAVDTDDGVLRAVAGYPINFVHEVVDPHGQAQDYTANDMSVFPMTTWSANAIVVKYSGGVPSAVFDAIRRQAKVLQTRSNLAPEMTSTNVPIEAKFEPAMRSGLAPDVKQMVFPFKVIGF